MSLLEQKWIFKVECEKDYFNELDISALCLHVHFLFLISLENF